MNKRKIYRIMAVVMCVVVVLALGSGMSASAESKLVSVSDINDFITALKELDDGDRILILEPIKISTDLPTPKGKITVERKSESVYLYTASGVEVNFKNIVFDGGSVKSAYPLITVQCDFSFEDCTFQNCGETGNKSSGSCIGAAVQIKNGNGSFVGCDFKDNNAVVGGHIALLGASVVSLTDCTLKGGYAGSGGAINIAATAACTIDSCVITENEAGDFGGGIANAGILTISNTKLYNNTAVNGGADIGNKIGVTVDLQDSVERLNELFADDNISVNGWVCDYDFTENPYIPDVEPTAENALLKLDYEYKEPETTEPESTEPTGTTESPEESEPTNTETEPTTEPTTETTTPDQTEQPAQSDEPTEDEPTESEPTSTAAASDTDEDQGGSTTTTTTTTTSSNSSTDNSNHSTNSTNSTDGSTTDNSHYTDSSGSNNTSTVNNYYQQEEQASGSGDTVQTIVVPVEGAGSSEPLQQTIRIESADGESAGTLNINVNIEQPQQAASTEQEESETGASWVEMLEICLLLGILVCIMKR